MSDFSMDELRDMAPAYVLGALNAEESGAFERALATSTDLAKEVAEFRAVVTHMGSASEIAPPPSVRARFLANISQSANAAAPNANAAAPIANAEAPPAQPARPLTVSSGNAAAPSRDATTPPAKQRWWLNAVLAAGMAASLLFAIQRNSQVSTLNATLAQRDSILAQRTRKLAERDSTLNNLLEAENNLVLVNLQSTPTNGPGVQFFWNVKQGRGVLHAFNLRPAAAGRAYQLWLIKDGKPVPSRVFNSDTDDHGLIWNIEMPTDRKGISAVAITDEPAGGSQQPTTTPFLVGAIAKALQ